MNTYAVALTFENKSMIITILADSVDEVYNIVHTKYKSARLIGPYAIRRIS
jgi:hypothetical protein